jgi:hypothetical protein
VGFENGKLLRLTLRATISGRQEVNTFHYDLQDSAIGGDNDPQDLADRFRDDVRPYFATLYVSAWTIEPVEIIEERDPLNPTAPRSAWSSGSPIAGTGSVSGDVLPTACCVVAKLRSAHIGRRFNGRIFLGGSISEGSQVVNNWNSATLAYYEGFLDTVPKEPDIAPGGSDSTARWCIYSRTQRAANLDPYASPVQDYTVRTPVHWLRRRAQI